MSLAALSNATCTIERIKNLDVVDDYNTPVDPVYETLDIEVRCRFAPRLSNVRGLGGFVGERWNSSVSSEAVHEIALLVLPRGTDIDEHDRIIDIRNEAGVVIESGPLDILLVRRTYRGRSEHHVSTVAKRLT